MKTAFAVIVVVIICLAAGCYAQSTSRFQSVGGDFGRSVIGSLKTNDTKPAAASNNLSDLWSWGNAPKGSMLVNGKLVADPFNTWKSLNYTDGWIGQAGVDPYTGYPIYAYKIPNTGETKYFYIDPYTGEPMYVERGNAIGTSNNVRSASYALPPVFSQSTPRA